MEDGPSGTPRGVIPGTPSSGALCAACHAAVEWGCDPNRQEGEKYEVKKYHQSFDALQSAAQHCDLCRVALYGAFLGGKSHFERELEYGTRSASDFEHYDLNLCYLGGLVRISWRESYKCGRSSGWGIARGKFCFVSRTSKSFIHTGLKITPISYLHL